MVAMLVLRVWSFLYLVFSEAAGTTAGMPGALDAEMLPVFYYFYISLS